MQNYFICFQEYKYEADKAPKLNFIYFYLYTVAPNHINGCLKAIYIGS